MVGMAIVAQRMHADQVCMYESMRGDVMCQNVWCVRTF
jgi:hypothetical protein